MTDPAPAPRGHFERRGDWMQAYTGKAFWPRLVLAGAKPLGRAAYQGVRMIEIDRVTALSHYRIGAPGTAADSAHPAPTAGTNNQPGDDMTATHTDPLRALLADLTTKLDAASGGPWQYDPSEGDTVWDSDQDRPSILALTRDPFGNCEADAALIVALRNHTPALIAAVQAVTDVHVPTVGGDWCAHCESMSDFRAAAWPCATVRALAAAVPADTEENAR